MASIGAVGQHFIKFPWAEKVHGTFGAMNSGEGVFGFVGLFVASGFLELAWRESDDREPGNFGDPLGFNQYNADMRLKEISNGRMAMISMLAIFVAEVASGKDAMEQFGLSALPRVVASRGAGASAFAGRTMSSQGARAKVAAAVATVDEVGEAPKPPFSPAQQIGAIAPLGFFDPLGFTSVGDERGFRKLQAAELKHGRVAMMASIGAVGQHFIKFPWAEKVHGTFGAMNSGEGVFGFVGLFVASGFLELAWRESDDREPGNFGDPLGFNQYNADMRLKEISNGRMAMISMLAIFVAEVASGKDAMEQFGL